jgi:hypothetical protein
VSPTPYAEPPQRSGLFTALVSGALIALVAANIYLYIQIDHLRGDLAKTNEALSTGISNIKDASQVTVAAQQRHIEQMKADLESNRKAMASMSTEAKQEAEAKAEQLTRDIANAQQKMQAQLSSDITDVKNSSAAAVAATNDRVSGVANDVGTVRTQATQTQDQLSKTISDLKSVTGDLGVQSGLIATNAKELQALRLKGERNYTDIRLGKTKQPQKFGDVALKLESWNPKKNTYSVTVLVDDKTTEKKDKGLNEPVQFYTIKGGHTPYELVINQVNKDGIVGYIATPKDLGTR